MLRITGSCHHDVSEQDVAAQADGLCPLCLFEQVAAAREFVKRHPALTLIDLAEFEVFLKVPAALASTGQPAMTVNAQTMLRELLDATKHMPVDMFLRQRCEAALSGDPAQPQCAREPVNQTSRDWSICNAVDAYRAPRNEGDTRTLSDFLEEQGLKIAANARPDGEASFKCNCEHESRGGCSQPWCPNYILPRPESNTP